MLEVGTKVRIKDAETLASENEVGMYGCIEIEDMFIEEMWRYCGQEATIIGIIEKGRPYTSYRIQFDCDTRVNCYEWNEWMFEIDSKEEYEPINIEDIL